MAKRLKFDESDGGDDLQALFDSIASEPAKPKLEVINQASLPGDDDQLQSLFDSVAAEFGDLVGTALPAALLLRSEAAGSTGSGAMQGEPVADALFERIGQITRQLHDGLQALAYEQSPRQAAEPFAAPLRLIDLARRLESQLLQALIEARPTAGKGADSAAFPNRQAIPAEGPEGAFASPAEVARVLQSLGF